MNRIRSQAEVPLTKTAGPLRLGIDAGGSFTDAALLDPGGAVIAWSKAPTTPRHPAQGIAAALRRLPPDALAAVGLVGLATTFATNAVVEGRGARAGLVLIGYDPPLPRMPGSPPLLPLGGGHDYWGEERRPLDRRALEQGLDKLLPGLQAVAVVGVFSVRNPEHELAAADLVAHRSGLPVVCGHRLSARLDVIRRATTAWWNARLIPLVTGLIRATEGVLLEASIHAPLMVVRGDGTLMSAATARERPVETLLSGPAASALGVRHLSGLGEGLVVDMGGTTTDLALLTRGRVALDPEGARVGTWQTHVEAARMRTMGLGGDSILTWKGGRVTVGPRRVEPLCLAADREPRVLHLLHQALSRRLSSRRANPSCFWLPLGEPDDLPPALRQGPLSEALLLEDAGRSVSLTELEHLDHDGLAFRSALTPTDLRAAVGEFDLGNPEAARLGIQLWARRAALEEDALVATAEEEIRRRLCVEAVHFADPEHGPGLAALWPSWFPADAPHAERTVGARVFLSIPVLGGGAPAAAFLPRAFERLGTRCELPAAAPVSTAVGAVVGAVEVTLRAEAHPTPGGACLLYLPEDRQEHPDLPAAVHAGRQALETLARARLAREGVTDPVVHFVADEKTVPLGGGGGAYHIRTELTLAASGRVNLAGGGEGRERTEA